MPSLVSEELLLLALRNLYRAVRTAAHGVASAWTQEIAPRVSGAFIEEHAGMFEAHTAKIFGLYRFVRDSSPSVVGRVDAVNASLVEVSRFHELLGKAQTTLLETTRTFQENRLTHAEYLKEKSLEVSRISETIIDPIEQLMSELSNVIRETLNRSILSYEKEAPAYDTIEKVTVVSVDLKGYGSRSKRIENATGSRSSIADLNDEIVALIVAALRESNIFTLWRHTGDGALMFFSEAIHADLFSYHFYKNLAAFRGVKSESHKRMPIEFRIGMATGDLKVRKAYFHEDDGLFEKGYASMAIIAAVRLESLAEPGEVLVCKDTLTMLKAKRDALKGKYSKVTAHTGKNDEKYRASSGTFELN